WLLAAGLTLGLATLTRPGYEYLFYAVAIVLAVLAIRFRTRTAAASVVLFAVAFAVTVAPWMLRNKQHFGTLALTSQYGGAILAQRIAYNRMSWPEIASAFVHWFPDFGQKISGALIAPRHYKKLTMGPAGYYQKDGPEVMREAHANAGGPDAVVPYLIRTGIVEQPVKHVFVSAALAWRAIFISKYWGIAGFICFIAVVIHGARRGEYGLLIASLPVWFMVAFHAFATVSINRYNLPLIPIYATAMAIAVVGIGRALRHRWPARQRASN
ncbi:MAG: hypothetical protein MJE12_19510, partial [Alphaproteobacteria bacterium]|nr:hypothetical protein [Alphaproteobacteria bacterium]